MALSQAATPQGVWLAAEGPCAAQGCPSVTNWMPPALLGADWAQQLNTRLWEVRTSHSFFCEFGQAPFLSMFLYNSHQQRHGNTPAMNEAVWPEHHMLSILPQVQQVWPLGIMASLHPYLHASSKWIYLPHHPSALVLKAFFPMYLNTFLFF